MTCMLCGKETSFFSSHKTMDGIVCKECYKKIPSLLFKDSKNQSESAIRIAKESAENNFERFSTTSSYGSLRLDENNGLFAIAKKIDKSGKPINSYNVFSIYDLDDIGINCASVQSDRNNLYTTVELTFKLLRPYMSAKVKIKKRAKCTYKRVDSSHIEWTEPKELTFFRSILFQFLSGSFEKLKEFLAGKTIHDWEIEKARTVFMLEEDYSEQDLKRARRLLMKVYHPDVAGEDTTRETAIINKMYDALKTELERRNKF